RNITENLTNVENIKVFEIINAYLSETLYLQLVLKVQKNYRSILYNYTIIKYMLCILCILSVISTFRNKNTCMLLGQFIMLFLIKDCHVHSTITCIMRSAGLSSGSEKQKQKTKTLVSKCAISNSVNLFLARKINERMFLRTGSKGMGTTTSKVKVLAFSTILLHVNLSASYRFPFVEFFDQSLIIHSYQMSKLTNSERSYMVYYILIFLLNCLVRYLFDSPTVISSSIWSNIFF
ncbi:hypothetical protein L9F63_012609, partial [Diploptera punctata]